MERPILWLIIVVNVIAMSIFAITKVNAHGTKTYVKYHLPHTARVGDRVQFSDETENALFWKWDFGDGEYSNTKSGEHIFLEPNTYNVKLTVYGSFGSICDSTYTVTVSGLEATENTEVVPVAEEVVPQPMPETKPAPQAPKKRNKSGGNFSLPDDNGAQTIEE